jgi:hypothetical protein
VTDLVAKYAVLPAVLGPEPDVARFAERWSRRTGATLRQGMRQRIFQATQVIRAGEQARGVLPFFARKLCDGEKRVLTSDIQVD